MALSVQELRDAFVNYFVKQGHKHLPSSPLIPPEDPTLMFTNAGMVQFKDVFLGQKKAPAPAVVTIQKCLRISGKHNDFDEVGFTNRHLTFFEMLGNFSFGKYFKEEAIAYAWEFLADVCGIDAERMYVTVHPTDKESENIWHKKIGVPKNRIFQFDEDNFWQMADTGPCGPCTEVHVDLGDKYGPVGGDNVVGGTGPRFIEVWNVVFMQYDRQPDGTKNNLPTPCVDTGMGLERLAAVIQGAESNFETDEFLKIRKLLEQASGVPYSEANRVNYRVACDHIRSLLFLMNEGIFPSNEGRGYVLRRIARRALRFIGQISDATHAMSDVIEQVAHIFKKPYPELMENLARHKTFLREEETRFFSVVKRGSAFLDVEIEKLTAKKIKTIPGQVAFTLHDTFGFPIDLTRLIAKQQSMQVDEAGFDAALEHQREQSRQQAAQTGEGAALLGQAREMAHWFDSLPATQFVGYDTLVHQGVLLKGLPPETESSAGDEALLVFDATSFYAEGGGQIGDVGVIRTEAGELVAKVKDTQKGFGEGVFVHVVELKMPVKEGATYILEVDPDSRRATVANHTATHLLHAALRNVLGTHVSQQGSFVSPDELRFDFSHPKKLSDEEKTKIETWVNAEIANALEVTPKQISIEQARKEGTVMFFDEKYGDVVRQLRVGPMDQTVSLELCGGTHVSNTQEILGFEITSEQSIAQGIRRIVAKAGPALLKSQQVRAKDLVKIGRLLSASPNETLDAVERLHKQSQAQRKLIEELITHMAESWADHIRDHKDDFAHCYVLPDMEPSKKVIRKLATNLVVHPNNIIMLVYGPKAAKRFALWFGSAFKKSPDLAKGLFENLQKQFKWQGGGGGTQFQGALPDETSLDTLKQTFEKEAAKVLKSLK